MQLHPQKRQTNPFVYVSVLKTYIHKIQLAILNWVKKHVSTLLISYLITIL